MGYMQIQIRDSHRILSLGRVGVCVRCVCVCGGGGGGGGVSD